MEPQEEEDDPVIAIGSYAMEFIQRCRDMWGNDVYLGEIVIIAEIPLEDDKGKYVEVSLLSSESRSYVTRAILEQAIDTVEAEELHEAMEHEEENE